MIRAPVEHRFGTETEWPPDTRQHRRSIGCRAGPFTAAAARAAQKAARSDLHTPLAEASRTARRRAAGPRGFSRLSERPDSAQPGSVAGRRPAPEPWPASLVAASRRGLSVWPLSDPRRSNAGGSVRLERRDSVVGTTAPQRSRSASAPSRLKRSRGLDAEPMLYWRSTHPSRRRIVRSAAQGLFFHGAKWSAEPPASLRRAPAGAVE
jgi:hypothetical protein